jgi:hypothetical protein
LLIITLQEEFLKSNNGSCRPATNLLTQLRKLTDDVTENNTDPSSALGRLSEIAETKWTGSPHNGPFGIEIGQAARLLHASVQRIPEPTVREFNDVSKTLTTVSYQTCDIKLPKLLKTIKFLLYRCWRQVNLGKHNFYQECRTLWWKA